MGEALLVLNKKGIKRKELFLQTKFTPINGQGGSPPYDASATITTQVAESFESSLKHLHTDYIDSYVLHGPYSGGSLLNEDWEVWAAIEAIYQSGKAKMIGISNVSAAQLRELCEKAAVKPMVVQSRCFARRRWDHELREVCRDNAIIYQGFSLLTGNQDILGSPEVGAIARRLNTGPLQVIFKFAMQIGMLPLTGTTNEKHMKDDLEVEKLGDLSPEEICSIEMVAV